ncbi:hypothetical protein ACFORH_09260 [Amycolatopsis roodepoortensis]|uniref:DUF4267 domain-containing protein n=1 Tax=Amycolatopsis roodepoortensis TaxID=700274 RepID=A0ABR9L9M5_9PSEU|nr:hypothetical protein [Amycolatopsis roodepoortensis]MBE1577356.1 hypothetical protein [Amycolatopsis roodepoortensis]
MPALTRVLGGITAAYSASLIVAPKILAKPSGLTGPAGSVPVPVRTLIAAIGARDTAIGVAMMLAPAGRPLQVALGARVAADAADAIIFGLTLPDKTARVKVAGFATGWAVLCALSGVRR